ncbi:uncharacterized protein N7518_003695 [Penicillium psychrosexuale]|uniref:uncharacterized protein n=1 Tax=Penicillium psychrosexuale TaxID=1002107 RepID=UPI002545A51D|nr:uncharacterized protein N7518_003695 [Penicillium psychrosexuale]KAJ5801627.1 hypothetical protein N7518_003695 [Penicillium psychrosexuale]
MAQYFQSEFYQQSPSTLDVTPEDDEMSVLDDRILDPNSEDHPDNRRTSYDAPDAYSHRDSVWSNYSNTSSQSQSNSNSNSHSQLGHTMMNSGASFMPIDGPQPSSYQQSCSQAAWPMPRTDSGSCTPTVGYDQYASNGDQSAVGPFSGGAVGPVCTMPMNPMSYRGGMPFAASGSVVMSPQSSQGWMPAPMDLAEAELQARKSPNYRMAIPLRRGDGIRKRNSRIEISAELTLANIDEAIRNCVDEEKKKDLKSIKRLLRNRDAALQSRQRKKKEAEGNIEKLKVKDEIIAEQAKKLAQLEEKIQNMQSAMKNQDYENHQLTAYNRQLTEHIQRQDMEKDETILRHTRETANLLKRNNMLEERNKQLERSVKPVQEIMTGEFTGFENPTMENHSWDDFSTVTGPLLQSDCVQTPHAQVKVPEKSNNGSDLPISWNAFYMFLLVGAFFASNNTSLPGNSLPQLSEEYRAESANVLKAVLASSSGHELTNSHSNHGTATGPAPATISGMEMAQMSSAQPVSSSLDQLHNTLVMPTEQQQRDQVFSMNADHYNSLTTFENDNGNFKPQQPSTLQQAFAAMRDTAAQQSRIHSALSSNVYSRSLMWDRVPEKVVRDFRRMVQGHGYDNPVKEEGIFHS